MSIGHTVNASSGTRKIAYTAWLAEAEQRFGKDPLGWKFVCPSCKGTFSVQDWKDAGASEGEVAFSCVGRRKGGDDSNTFSGNGRRCTYAGGGLFRLNPVHVEFEDGKVRETFEFASDALSDEVSP